MNLPVKTWFWLVPALFWLVGESMPLAAAAFKFSGEVETFLPNMRPRPANSPVPLSMPVRNPRKVTFTAAVSNDCWCVITKDVRTNAAPGGEVTERMDAIVCDGRQVAGVWVLTRQTRVGLNDGAARIWASRLPPAEIASEVSAIWLAGCSADYFGRLSPGADTEPPWLHNDALRRSGFALKTHWQLAGATPATPLFADYFWKEEAGRDDRPIVRFRAEEFTTHGGFALPRKFVLEKYGRYREDGTAPLRETVTGSIHTISTEVRPEDLQPAFAGKVLIVEDCRRTPIPRHSIIVTNGIFPIMDSQALQEEAARQQPAIRSKPASPVDELDPVETIPLPLPKTKQPAGR